MECCSLLLTLYLSLLRGASFATVISGSAKDGLKGFTCINGLLFVYHLPFELAEVASSTKRLLQ